MSVSVGPVSQDRAGSTGFFVNSNRRGSLCQGEKGGRGSPSRPGQLVLGRGVIADCGMRIAVRQAHGPERSRWAVQYLHMAGRPLNPQSAIRIRAIHFTPPPTIGCSLLQLHLEPLPTMGAPIALHIAARPSRPLFAAFYGIKMDRAAHAFFPRVPSRADRAVCRRWGTTGGHRWSQVNSPIQLSAGTSDNSLQRQLEQGGMGRWAKGRR